MKKNKNGFTLVELLIVMAIITSLMVMAIGIINPTAMMAKARDAERKSDLSKIKKAFEEYWSDKGYYPKSEDLARWNVVDNCGKKVDEMGGYLDYWPCDPSGTVYTILSIDNWFKVITNLENKKDADIPPGWYEEGSYIVSSFNKNTVNYGVSSTNILWYEDEGSCYSDVCYSGADCNAPIGNSCKVGVNGVLECYLLSRTHEFDEYRCKDPVCKRSCCGVGCND